MQQMVEAAPSAQLGVLAEQAGASQVMRERLMLLWLMLQRVAAAAQAWLLMLLQLMVQQVLQRLQQRQAAS